MGLYLAEVERVEAVETRLAGGVLHFRLSEWLQENAAKLEKIITEVYHWRMAAVETISLREIQKRSWPRVPFLTAASCSLVSFSVPKVSTVPGNVNKSWAMAPAVASMARRPFFSSASRNHRGSSQPEMESGSKPASPAQEPSNIEVLGRPRGGIATLS
jgi:hypothetical protein